MRKKLKLFVPLIGLVLVITLASIYLHKHTVDVLQPVGQVGNKERNLLIFASILAIVVVVPTFILTIFIAVRYRENNPKTQQYNPDWDRSKLFESIWWGIPVVIIAVLSVVTWNSSQALDPYKKIVSDKKPLTVQVVALDWKWLFIYPDQHIASVNMVQFPVGTPVSFEITSDTVMNSFWVPSLGGQIYAMPGMQTELNLVAAKSGSYHGSSANISGSGFAGMTFTAKASSPADFTAWVRSVQTKPNILNATTYSKLAKPSTYNSATYYSAVQNNLYTNVMLKYMVPSTDMKTGANPGMSMPGMQL